jgi:hypothetical protein
VARGGWRLKDGALAAGSRGSHAAGTAASRASIANTPRWFGDVI